MTYEVNTCCNCQALMTLEWVTSDC